MESSRDSLLRSRLTRRTATVTISAPLASSERAVSWKDLYFPVPTIRRERKERPAMTRGSVMILHCKSSEGNVEWMFDAKMTRTLYGAVVASACAYTSDLDGPAMTRGSVMILHCKSSEGNVEWMFDAKMTRTLYGAVVASACAYT